MNGPVILDRRRVLAGGGALIVSFSLSDALAQDQKAMAAAPPPNLPGSLKGAPFLDSWIRIDADGSITVFTGKAELGQGFKTAFQQIAAEELDVAFESLKVVTADTGRTANEGYTSGSHSTQDSGTAVQNAAAQVRQLLIAEAARRLNLPVENFRTENGAVIALDGQRFGRQFETPRRFRDQERADLRGGMLDRGAAVLHRIAAGGVAFIGGAAGIGRHQLQ